MKFNFGAFCLRRIFICILASVGMFVAVSLSVNMTVSIVSMTTNHSTLLENGTETLVVDFEWDSVTKGHILSSFFYGQQLSMILGGVLCSYFGGAVTFGGGIVCSAIFNLLTPFASNYGIYPIIILRALTGLCVGLTTPCVQELFSKWAPPEERSRMVTFAIMGADIGNVLCFLLYGVMAHYWRWSLLFYVPGICSILWSCTWFGIVNDDPADDPKISDAELHYLQSFIDKKSQKKVQTPWREIMTSKSVWALTVGIFANGWGFYTVYVELPMFLKDVFHYDAKEIGYTSLTPYIALAVSTILAGILSDYLVQHKGFSITTTRKLFACCSLLFAGVSVVVIAFSDSIYVVVLMLNLMMTCQGLFNASLMVNCLDIAPKHAGIISGLSLSIGYSPAFIVPTVTGYIVTNRSRHEWKIAYLICCVLHAFGALIFAFFGSGVVQPWAADKEEVIIECDVHHSKPKLEFDKNDETKF